MLSTNWFNSWYTVVRRTLKVSVSKTVTVPPLVVVLSTMPVLVVVMEESVPVVVVPV
jgi:hypothetical protein